MKRTVGILIFLCCFALICCGCKPAHTHTYGEWTLQEEASCSAEGREDRVCTECHGVESRAIAKLPHELKANICKKCGYVEFDPDATVAELGIACSRWYNAGEPGNRVWDVKIWNGKVYRGAGDYNKNSGETPILAYDIQTRKWEMVGTAADEAIQRFVEIEGTLYAPGIDPLEGWEYGNYYVLEGQTWQKKRNLPNGLHNFDMIEFDGKIFAGLGTETLGNTVAVSQDKGESFSFVPLYRDGALLDTSGYEYSRTYAFVEYSDSLYAFVTFKKTGALAYDRFVFRYENGTMVYQSVLANYLSGKTGENHWQGRLEWNGVCYLTSTRLNAVTDFSKPDTHKQISMPNGGVVTDILLYNDELYVLSYTFNQDMTCKAVIYKSANGEEGSFSEVVSFQYAGIPISFDFDGDHFYVGIGSDFTNQARDGMLLRVKPGA